MINYILKISTVLLLLTSCLVSSSSSLNYAINKAIEEDKLESPSEQFDHMIILKEPDTFVLYWSYNSTDIKFEVHVKSSGWFGFGLSPGGFMDYSDIVIGWLREDGTGHFSGDT